MSRHERSIRTKWTPELQETLDMEIPIGAEIQKVSRRPFRSGLYTATVMHKGISPLNPGRITVVLEDGSWVEIHKCELVK